MLVPAPRTAFAQLGPRAARAVLLTTALTIFFLVVVSLSPLRNRHLESVRDGGGEDLRLYAAEIERVHSGEDYYHVAGEELRSRGYATRSVFNWRPPALVQLMAALPSIWLGRLALAGVALAVLILSFRRLEEEAGSRAALGGSLLMVGALLPAFMGEGYVLHEVWAATLMALSFNILGTGRLLPGVLCGIAALVAREHAALYVAVCLAIAVRRRAWREAAAWTAGFVAYLFYFGWHAWTVSGLIGPEDLEQAQGWVQLAGAPFVIAAGQMNCFLLLLPQWVTAVYLPLAMLGFVGWRTAYGERAGLVAAAYLAAFAVVGQPFNQYWGVLIAPVLVLGFARAPAALVDLWRAAATSGKLVVERV